MKYLGGRGLIIMAVAGLSLTLGQRVCLATDEGRQVKMPMVSPMIYPGDVILHWTATGDDGNSGQAAGYDLRYVPVSLGPINTEEKWNQATQLSGLPHPCPAGGVDSVIISGFTPGANYYFCIKAYDEAGNYSHRSNSPLVQAADGSDFIPGDVNGSGHVDGLDLIFLVNYLKGGPEPPAPIFRADCNGSCDVNGNDVFYLCNYLRGGGPLPIRGNCNIVLNNKKAINPGQ